MSYAMVVEITAWSVEGMGCYGLRLRVLTAQG